MKTFSHHIRCARLHANDPAPWIVQFHGCGNSRDEPPAAHRDNHRRYVGNGFGDFDSDGSCRREDLAIPKGMYQGVAMLINQFVDASYEISLHEF